MTLRRAFSSAIATASSAVSFVAADASDVLITLKQTNAERGEAKTMVREQMRAELPAILAELVLSARSARARHRAYRLAALSINN